jgi:hypothetical protein
VVVYRSFADPCKRILGILNSFLQKRNGKLFRPSGKTSFSTNPRYSDEEIDEDGIDNKRKTAAICGCDFRQLFLGRNKSGNDF